MLTVALDTGPLYGPRTGVGRAVAEILAELHARSSTIEILPYVVSRRAELDTGTRRLPIPAFVAMQAWSRSDHPRPDRFLRPASVVHGTNYVVPPVRCPRVVSVYDTWALRHPDATSPAVNRAMRVLRRNIASGAVVHTSSQATAGHLLDIFPDARVHVVHLGAPTRRAHDSSTKSDRSTAVDSLLETNEPFVLAVGTIERRKNFPRLIEAFGATEAARRGIRLVIAGGHGDDLGAVMSAIDGLGDPLHDRVLVLGRTSDSDLGELYRRAEMVAYVSLDEGFGFPVLEAMSHGVPVLGSTSGSIPEIAGDAAMLVDPTDPDEIGSLIDRMISDHDLRTSLIRRGAARCDRFPWSATADGLIDLYASLASGH